MVLLAPLPLLASRPSEVAWEPQRRAIQTLLLDPRLVSTFESTVNAPKHLRVVVPFVPRGTRFVVGRRSLRSSPWLSDRARGRVPFLEIDVLQRWVQMNPKARRTYFVGGVLRTSNLHFEAKVEEIGRHWAVSGLRLAIE